MHNQQVASGEIVDAIRERQARQVRDARLTNLLTRPAHSVTLLLALLRRLRDCLQVHISLNHRTTQLLYKLQYFAWTRAIQTEVACDHYLITTRLLRQVA